MIIEKHVILDITVFLGKLELTPHLVVEKKSLFIKVFRADKPILERSLRETA